MSPFTYSLRASFIFAFLSLAQLAWASIGMDAITPASASDVAIWAQFKDDLDLGEKLDNIFKKFPEGGDFYAKLEEVFGNGNGGFTDPNKLKKFLGDISAPGNEGLLDLFKRNPDAIRAWKVLSERPDWVRNNSELLKKISDKSDEYLESLNSLYQNFQLPSGFIPPRNFNGIKFNKFGFPDLRPFALDRKYYFNQSVQGNYTSDFRSATDWLKNQRGILNVDDYNGTGSPINVQLEGGSWKKITWHHHEDGITLMPVFTDIHNMLTGKHTGGVAVSNRGLQGLFDSP